MNLSLKLFSPALRGYCGGRLFQFFLSSFAVMPILTNAQVTFELLQIDTMRAEGVAVGDIDGDGTLDIVAGDYWYAAPTWDPVRFRDLTTTTGTPVTEEGRGKLKSDFEILLDVDGDDKLDVISGSYNSALRWYKNTDGSDWPSTVVDATLANFHEAELWDVDGDGSKKEFVTGLNPVRWFEISGGAVTQHVVSDNPGQWGSGVGDINMDGRPDLVRSNAWFEAPQDPRTTGWTKNCLALGYDDRARTFYMNDECGESEHTQQILVLDVDGDGLNDIVTGAAHTYGFFWYQQTVEGQERSWQKHIIDDTWSQVHALMTADVDGDGDLDVVTGKRWYAHDGNDPGGKEPNGLYWYELDRGYPDFWIKHVISHDEGIGAGTQVAVFDYESDGDSDFAVTTKQGGPWLIVNTTPVRVKVPDFSHVRDIRVSLSRGTIIITSKNGTDARDVKGQVLKDLILQKKLHTMDGGF